MALQLGPTMVTSFAFDEGTDHADHLAGSTGRRGAGALA